METERPKTFVARWIAVVLLVVSWLAVGIRYLLDSEEDPRITTAFMITRDHGVVRKMLVDCRDFVANRLSSEARVENDMDQFSVAFIVRELFTFQMFPRFEFG